MAMLDLVSMTHQEQGILSKAKMIYIENQGKKQINNCLREAIDEMLSLNYNQFYAVFGIDINDYINYLNKKIKIF